MRDKNYMNSGSDEECRKDIILILAMKPKIIIGGARLLLLLLVPLLRESLLIKFTNAVNPVLDPPTLILLPPTLIITLDEKLQE